MSSLAWARRGERVVPVAKQRALAATTAAVAATLLLTACAPTIEYRGPESMESIVYACAHISMSVAAAGEDSVINDNRVIDTTATQTEVDLENREFTYEVTGRIVVSAGDESVFDWECTVTVSGTDRSLVANLTSFVRQN